uniref:Gastrotropin-like n=1 Tax=Cynoglossus semilaevis TaxID=244447 RepID=A0A3P8X609_CYNSE
MIVNEQEAESRAMYWELKRRAPPDVPVYQQGPFQDDVWETLDGDKDDFLVYDRCGLLTFHIVLPYSFLQYPYVEAAVRATYLKNICNCSQPLNNPLPGVMKNETASPFNQTITLPVTPQDTDIEEGGDATVWGVVRYINGSSLPPSTLHFPQLASGFSARKPQPTYNSKNGLRWTMGN